MEDGATGHLAVPGDVVVVAELDVLGRAGEPAGEGLSRPGQPSRRICQASVTSSVNRLTSTFANRTMTSGNGS